MKSQRLDMIEEYVLEHKNASLDTLCEKFNVSKNTGGGGGGILL